MSAFDLSLVSCGDIQLGLNRAFAASGPLNEEFLPVTNFLLSEVNTENVLQRTISPGNGKNFVAKTIYTPRITEDDVSTAIARACASTKKAGNTYSICEVDLEVGAELEAEVIEIADLAAICEGTASYTQSRLAAMFSAMRRKIETELTDQLAAGPGNFPSDDNEGVAAGVKVVQTLTSTGGTDLSAIEELGYTKDNMGLPRLFTFGSNLITKYFKRLDAGCCVDGYGVDLREFYGNQGIVHAHSYRIASAFANANDFLALIPGAAHMVYVNLYAGENSRDTGSFKRIVLNDPLTGLPIDFKFTDTCDGIVVTPSLAFKVCVAPPDMFALNDRMSGVNGLFHFRVTNP